MKPFLVIIHPDRHAFETFHKPKIAFEHFRGLKICCQAESAGGKQPLLIILITAMYDEKLLSGKTMARDISIDFIFASFNKKLVDVE